MEIWLLARLFFPSPCASVCGFYVFRTPCRELQSSATNEIKAAFVAPRARPLQREASNAMILLCVQYEDCCLLLLHARPLAYGRSLCCYFALTSHLLSPRVLFLYFSERQVRGSALRDEFSCPITRELMRDPVIAADGHTYDREAIEMWLRNHDTSPKVRGCDNQIDNSVVPFHLPPCPGLSTNTSVRRVRPAEIHSQITRLWISSRCNVHAGEGREDHY